MIQWRSNNDKSKEKANEGIQADTDFSSSLLTSSLLLHLYLHSVSLSIPNIIFHSPFLPSQYSLLIPNIIIPSPSLPTQYPDFTPHITSGILCCLPISAFAQAHFMRPNPTPLPRQVLVTAPVPAGLQDQRLIHQRYKRSITPRICGGLSCSSSAIVGKPLQTPAEESQSDGAGTRAPSLC
ncbi:hypothetical protein E2C01_011964 [Portunus trituberculatus]|uniref:Uncharacterized protein n=1 Tax=Portunus trituberculatus TaxID=210409 RepID=A0A5B7DCP6_PORTR|nr:hypothetical protein [Portunus trituberculatus]